MKSICLRLSAGEHQILAGKARAAGITVSALLRDHIGHVKVYNHKETRVWLATLLSIRKQLTSLAERAVVLSPADGVIAIAYLASIAGQLERFTHYDPRHAYKIFSQGKCKQ